METTLSRKHLPCLDGWRGVAIVLVLLGHFTVAHFGDVSRATGRLGVEFFFVLSGLLMGKILFVDKMPFPVFYRHRIARLLPVLYLYLAFMMMTYKISPRSWDDITCTLFFLRTYIPTRSIFDQSLPLGHLWSLNVEVHCYILLSLISLFVPGRDAQRSGNIIMRLAFCCAGFYLLYDFFPPKSLSPVSLRTECAGFGLLVSCALFLRMRDLPLRFPPYTAVILGVIAVINFYISPDLIAHVLTPLLLAVSVNTLETAPAWFTSILNNPVLRWFGACSYSLYVWQLPFYLLQERKGGVASLEYFLLALLAGVLSYYACERPLRRWITGAVGNNGSAMRDVPAQL